MATSQAQKLEKLAQSCSNCFMTARLQLSDSQWLLVHSLLFPRKTPGRPGKNNRLFIEAVLWWRRTGVPWRDLHPDFGPWKTVFNRFDRWSKLGRWARLFEQLRTDPDLEWHSIDSTINRAHQHAAGGKGGSKFVQSDVPVAA
jgi:putative transposase